MSTQKGFQSQLGDLKANSENWPTPINHSYFVNTNNGKWNS